MPSADNTRLTLVRPSDEIRLVAPMQSVVKLELLVESIGGTNELGTRLAEWGAAVQRTRDEGVRVAVFTTNAVVAAWLGKLHVIYDAAVGGSITLPPRSAAWSSVGAGTSA